MCVTEGKVEALYANTRHERTARLDKHPARVGAIGKHPHYERLDVRHADARGRVGGLDRGARLRSSARLSHVRCSKALAGQFGTVAVQHMSSCT